jgi:hypothetical protein
MNSQPNNQQRYQLIEPRGAHAQSQLGEGAYGVVYKALDRQSQRHVALKKIRMETESDGISSSTLREITLLLQLNHENVVKLENVVMDKERMSLIFELVDTDLKKYMDMQQGPLSMEKVRVIISFLDLIFCDPISIVLHKPVTFWFSLLPFHGSYAPVYLSIFVSNPFFYLYCCC